MRRLDRFDGRNVQMVVMRMGDQDHVGLRQRRVSGVAADGIDIDVFAADLDRKRGVPEEGDRDLRAVACGQRVGGVFGRCFLSAAEQ